MLELVAGASEVSRQLWQDLQNQNPLILNTYSACLGLQSVYKSGSSIHRDFSMKWKGLKELTPDIHTTIRTKCMGSPVILQGQ